MDLSHKIASVIIDSLSIEDIEKLLAKKKLMTDPKEISEEQQRVNYYTEQIIKQKILYPPKQN